MQAYIEGAERKWDPVFSRIMSFRDEKDRDGPPGFTIVELRKFVQDGLKQKVLDDEVKAIFLDLDVEHKAYVGRPVFVKEMSKLPRKEAFAAAFDMRDYNRDGFLTKEEVKAAFDMVGVKEERAMKFFNQVDTNKDGTISRIEFMKMV